MLKERRLNAEVLAADLLPVLKWIAGTQRIITYGDLVEVAKSTYPDDYSRLYAGSGVLAKALGHVSNRTWDEDGVALTAIVVNQSGMPGAGFLGAIGADPDGCTGCHWHYPETAALSAEGRWGYHLAKVYEQYREEEV